jgi:phosphoribosylanthranilate isomerase
VKVKICGVNSQAAAEAASDAGADWAGFVFARQSPRTVTAGQARELAARLHATLPIGLFVEPDDDTLRRVLDAVQLHALQIYASAARCRDIAALTGLPVWRSVLVSSSADLPAQGDGEAWVIEPRPVSGASRPGGNGQAMDWSMLQGWQAARPWILAGGLTPANVSQAIEQTGASAVDVSSGVESAPGVKSPELIADFIHNAKQAVLF